MLNGDEINGKKKFSIFLPKEKIMRERERKGAKEKRGQDSVCEGDCT